MAVETSALIARVKSDPQFHDLVRKRSRFAWTLTALMIAIYFGFVLTLAFNKQLFAQPILGGVTTLGIPVGIGVILAAFVLTGIYVVRANITFDDMTKKIIERAGQ